MADLIPQLYELRLTTAEILYRLPDHPALLQTYIWQDYDAAPDFPKLLKFVEFWEREIDGALHKIYLKNVTDVTAGRFTSVPVEIQLS